MIGWFVLLLIAVLAALSWLRARLRAVEDALVDQQRTIDALTRQLEAIGREAPPAVAPPQTRARAAETPPPRPEPLHIPPPVLAPPPVIAPPALSELPHVRVEGPALSESSGARVEGPPRPPVGPPAPPLPPRVPFDWESLVGVKLFSAIAGIALVLAAVFFLRYSIDRGWLSPAVRVAIGITVAVALLVVCELKAARKYTVTANALDAAGIAILFSTFFAAHTLWQLIPAVPTFALMALVTVLAVLLSIRHDSMFIAVLGLVGGFATPALLSTGENRPISLFGYVLLLNIGLAWVASRRRWPVLTILTLAFTAFYQWGWVLQFLTSSQLSLAMGIFLLFSIASFFALTFRARSDNAAMETTLDRSGLAASAMPLAFAVYVAAVPAYGAHAGLLFGFLFLIDAALLSIAIARRQDVVHVAGAAATLLVFAIWIAMAYAPGAWLTGVGFDSLFVVLYLLAPLIAARANRPFGTQGARSIYAAPLLLFVFPVIAGVDPALETPWVAFGALFALLVLVAWRAVATPAPLLYFFGAFLALVAEASWSATFLTVDHLGRAIGLYVAFAVFYLGVPIAARRTGRRLEPAWGGGAMVIVSLGLLLFLALGVHGAAALWGLALLLAILDAGLFVESAAVGMPLLSQVGGALSWLVLAVWWGDSAATVGLLPSLLVLTGLTLLMLGGYAYAVRSAPVDDAAPRTGFQRGVYLAFVGHFFLFFVAINPEWAAPPWPLLGALAVLTLATSATSLAVRTPSLHASGVVAASLIGLGWALASAGDTWARVAVATTEGILLYGLAWMPIARRADGLGRVAAMGVTAAALVAEFAAIGLEAASPSTLPLPPIALVHVANASLLLALSWRWGWDNVAPGAVIPAWLATMAWQRSHPEPAAWSGTLALATVLYATFVAFPFVLRSRARDSRTPHLTAVLASALFFIAAREALVQGGLTAYIGAVPVIESAILGLLLRQLLRMQAPGERDLARLATVAGAALAFVTVAIPLQLRHQWITIGWALEGAALAWLYRRIPHRGLLISACGLLGAVFGRLALNPEIFFYEPRGVRVFNWYLYTYLICAVSMMLAAWWLSTTDDRLLGNAPRASRLLPAGGSILLFLLLNIEIADFYATGPEITFRFGVTLAQDLTYTIGWLVFGLAALMTGIYMESRSARVAAVVLIAVTTCKAFLYDLSSLGGLYRVAALVGLAISLALVAVALQKFVLQAPKEAS